MYYIRKIKSKKINIPLHAKANNQSEVILSKEYIKANLYRSSLFAIYPKLQIYFTNKFKKLKYTKRIFSRRFIQSS